ncbi:hypothetical protein CGCSCA4_v003203 [Colletotrichum siamense]|uniref:Uncharacterized protein n=1 Tax=Colletotrichum siamense TaxID=690259 RepID=A0A9P5K532_COLSI|nr:hypothetical protein CGCSCA4_v003203 [Colletotrichum siamense]KAF4859444.1 hypothetical protein CGCSCA2_v006412 [Colletotrichum siamense]
MDLSKIPITAPPGTDIIYDPSHITENTTLPRSEEFELRKPHGCPENELLVWPFPGPLSDIRVLDPMASPKETYAKRQPFVVPGADGAMQTFHPIASLPACYPLVSRLTVEVDHLKEFESVCHRISEHHEFKLDDDGNDVSEYCIDEECQDHPWRYYQNPPKLHVDAKQRPFVTLGEVVVAVHEWLHTLHDDIILAESATFGDAWGQQWPPFIPRDTMFWIDGCAASGYVTLTQQGPNGSGNGHDRNKYWKERLGRMTQMRKQLTDEAGFTTTTD